jgi:hypothetical protein
MFYEFGLFVLSSTSQDESREVCLLELIDYAHWRQITPTTNIVTSGSAVI